MVACVAAVAAGCTTSDGLGPDADDDRSSSVTSRGDDDGDDPLADRREGLTGQIELLRARPSAGLYLCSRPEPGCDAAVTEERLEELRTRVEGEDDASDVVVLSPEDAYALLLEMVGEEHATATGLGPEDLPRTVWFELAPGAEVLLAELGREPDVIGVVDHRATAVGLEQLLTTPLEPLAELHDHPWDRTLVSVELCVEAAPGCAAPATDTEIAAVREALEADARVDDPTFLTAEERRDAVRDLVGDDEIDLDGLGPAFRLVVRSADAGDVAADLRGRAGVLEVVTNEVADLLA